MKDIKEITEQLEHGVREVFESENYKRYLSYVQKFHNYSVNNIILIMIQKPEATLVAGYKAWHDKFNRQVRKGEKGIRILAPQPHKIKKEVDGEEVEKSWVSFKTTTVFDISQTDGEEIPTYSINELQGDVISFKELMDRLISISPVKIEFDDISTSSAKGYYSYADDRIVIRSGMSEAQTIKTMIHEISHAILHGRDSKITKEEKEVQAESVAYVVCNALGVDTSDYSFGYIAGWSSGKEVKELVRSMELIRETANIFLEQIKNKA